MRILFAGGGTGGHFFPILAVIKELKRIEQEEKFVDLELFYMSPDKFGHDLMELEGVIPLKIVSGKLRTYSSFENLTDILKIFVGTIRALWDMFLIMPDVIFIKGGYGSLPAVIASIIYRIPMMVHESDSIPGKTNQFAAKYARRIGIAFSSAADYFPKDKTALVGIPIRKRLLGGNKTEAIEELGISSKLPVLGFIGGSQGAERLNTAVLSMLKDMTQKYEVLHQTGLDNYKETLRESEIILEFGHKERYHPIGFFDENGLRNFFAVCDLIVSRAGATSIYELAFSGKPVILFPLKIASRDHQRKNAYEYAAAGGAVIIEEENLTPYILMSEIEKILNDPARIQKMREGAQKFSRIDSAELIAHELLKIGAH